jgi:hypothetical protein
MRHTSVLLLGTDLRRRLQVEANGGRCQARHQPASESDEETPAEEGFDWTSVVKVERRLERRRHGMKAQGVQLSGDVATAAMRGVSS